MNKTNADKYYEAMFPAKLFAHDRGNVVTVSTNEDPEDGGAIIAEIPNDERGKFVMELCRRWNHSPRRENALMDIKSAMGKRKTCVRMPNGMMLDTFCGQALLD